MNAAKKDKESRVFDQLQKQHYPALRRIPRSIEDRPDVICELAGKRIGIELTEYHHEDKLKEGQAICEGIVRSAKAIYDGMNGKTCTVRFHFDKNWQLYKTPKPKKIKDYIVAQIPLFVKAYVDNDDYDVKDCYDELAKYGLAEVFYGIAFYHGVAAKNDWAITSSFFSRPIEDEVVKELHARVQAKETDYPNYMAPENNIEECWLLLHYDGDETSDLDLNRVNKEVLQQGVGQTPYSKVMLFDFAWSGTLIELK